MRIFCAANEFEVKDGIVETYQNISFSVEVVSQSQIELWERNAIKGGLHPPMPIEQDIDLKLLGQGGRIVCGVFSLTKELVACDSKVCGLHAGPTCQEGWMDDHPPPPTPSFINLDGQAKRVCIIYDKKMLKHAHPCDAKHVEKPERIQSIYNSFEKGGVLDRCTVYTSMKAKMEHIEAVHEEAYIQRILSPDRKQKQSMNNRDMYYSDGTAEAVLLAAGGAVKACKMVASGEFQAALAVIRPPGHHAKTAKESGFCFFNNIAIAARYLQSQHGLKRILLVDWDYHHGDGTQEIFYGDRSVLFISVHRYGSNIFPKSSGTEIEIGRDEGVGFNCNVCWREGGEGDDDLYAVWDHVVMPLAQSFNPEIILVSGGFDAAFADALGDCKVTAKGFATVLSKLMKLEIGIVLALEGGYNLDRLGECALACAKVLLGDSSNIEDTNLCVHQRPLGKVYRRNELKQYWPCMELDIPNEVLRRRRCKPPED
ncbi:hypothetical protein ACP4OV_018842 [Aristida adscensionis]